MDVGVEPQPHYATLNTKQLDLAVMRPQPGTHFFECPLDARFEIKGVKTIQD